MLSDTFIGHESPLFIVEKTEIKLNFTWNTSTKWYSLFIHYCFPYKLYTCRASCLGEPSTVEGEQYNSEDEMEVQQSILKVHKSLAASRSNCYISCEYLCMSSSSDFVMLPILVPLSGFVKSQYIAYEWTKEYVAFANPFDFAIFTLSSVECFFLAGIHLLK